jgi:hypothetical protein
MSRHAKWWREKNVLIRQNSGEVGVGSGGVRDTEREREADRENVGACARKRETMEWWISYLCT